MSTNKKSSPRPLSVRNPRLVKLICLKCGYVLETVKDAGAVCCHEKMDQYAKWKEKYIK